MVYVFYSVDPQMARHAAERLIKKDFPVKDEFNYVSLNMEQSTLLELAAECDYVSFASERKCVLATDCAFLAKGKYKYKEGDSSDNLLAYLKNPNAFIDLYLLVYAAALDDKNPLVIAAKETGSVKEVPLPSPEEWVAFAKRFVSLHNKAPIEDDAAEELVRRCDGDYGRFQCELRKLVCYANGESIAMAAIQLLVPPKPEERVYMIADALVKGNNGEALAIYRDLKTKGADEFGLVITLANQFVFMDQVRYLDAKGVNERDIASELKKSYGQVKATIRNLYRMKQDSLPRILEELYQCQKEIFAYVTPPEFTFTRFLTNFTI